MKRTLTRIGTAVATLSLATVLGTSSAQAVTVTINISRYATATTTVKKLNQTATFDKTPFTGTLAFSGATVPAPITAQMALPPTTMTMNLGSLNLVKVTMKIIEPSAVTGNATFSGAQNRYWHFETQQSFRIQISKISPLGQDWINLVGANCKTGVTTAHLSGGFDITTKGPGGPFDYVMSGAYDIPQFSGCGLLVNPLLNLIVAGPGNPIAVHLTSS